MTEAQGGGSNRIGTLGHPPQTHLADRWRHDGREAATIKCRRGPMATEGQQPSTWTEPRRQDSGVLGA